MKKQQVTKEQKEAMLTLLNNIKWLADRRLWFDDSFDNLKNMIQQIEVED